MAALSRLRSVLMTIAMLALVTAFLGCEPGPSFIGSPALHFYEEEVGTELAQFTYRGPGTIRPGRVTLSERTNYRINSENCNGATLSDTQWCEAVIEHVNRTTTFSLVSVSAGALRAEIGVLGGRP